MAAKLQHERFHPARGGHRVCWFKAERVEHASPSSPQPYTSSRSNQWNLDTIVAYENATGGEKREPHRQLASLLIPSCGPLSTRSLNTTATETAVHFFGLRFVNFKHACESNDCTRCVPRRVLSAAGGCSRRRKSWNSFASEQRVASGNSTRRFSRFRH